MNASLTRNRFAKRRLGALAETETQQKCSLALEELYAAAKRSRIRCPDRNAFDQVV